jgi:hypothetical protein
MKPMLPSDRIAPTARAGGAIALLAALLLTPGCISSDHTTYREERRLKVEFENDTAGRLFYEALSRMREKRGKNESHTEVALPIVFERKTTVVEGESIVFNEAVDRCDTNHDGKITELEARIFSEQVK